MPEFDDLFGPGSQLSEDFEKIFKMSTIDRIRKVRINIKLVDKDGDEVALKEICKELMQYLKDKTAVKSSSVDNAILNKVMPLVSQAAVSGLPRVVGADHALIYLSIEEFRLAIITMMLLSFSLMQFVKSHELKIVTMEESMTDEELEQALKLNKATSVATLGSLMGMSPQEIIKELTEKTGLSHEDAARMAGSDETDVFSDTEEEEEETTETPGDDKPEE